MTNTNDQTFSYRFPSGIIAFWIILSPVILCSATIIFSAITAAPIDGVAPLARIRSPGVLAWFAMLLPLSLATGTFMTNSFPRIRTTSDGIELRFYFPFLTRWFRLDWAEIDGAYRFGSTFDTILNRRPSDTSAGIAITSRRLPLFYLFPSLLFYRRASRSIFLPPRLRDFDKLIEIISVHINIE